METLVITINKRYGAVQCSTSKTPFNKYCNAVQLESAAQIESINAYEGSAYPITIHAYIYPVVLSSVAPTATISVYELSEATIVTSTTKTVDNLIATSTVPTDSSSKPGMCV